LDGPVEPSGGGPYDRDPEPRLSRVENDVRDIKDTLVELKVVVARMEAKLDATLPHLATKAEIAGLEVKLTDKPGKAYMWGILAVLLTAYACGLAALAVLK
jgi:hypothetical protein